MEPRGSIFCGMLSLSLQGHPIEGFNVARGNRIPHGTTTLPLFIEGVPEGGGSLVLRATITH